MPIKVIDQLPAVEALSAENVFVMTESRAQSQDIRPMKIAILNLMPNKIATEVQLLRLLANSPLQVDVDLLRIDDHVRNLKHYVRKTLYISTSTVRQFVQSL